VQKYIRKQSVFTWQNRSLPM